MRDLVVASCSVIDVMHHTMAPPTPYLHFASSPVQYHIMQMDRIKISFIILRASIPYATRYGSIKAPSRRRRALSNNPRLPCLGSAPPPVEVQHFHRHCNSAWRRGANTTKAVVFRAFPTTTSITKSIKEEKGKIQI